MVNVRRLKHTVHNVNRRVVHKITAFLLVEKSHNSLICRTQTGLKGQQPRRRKDCAVDRVHRIWTSIDLLNHVLNVIGIAGFVRTAIHLTQNPAPIPPRKCFDCVWLIAFGFSENSTDCRKRNQLRCIWQVSLTENALIPKKKLLCYFEPRQHCIPVRYVRFIRKSQNILLFAGDGVCISRLLVQIACIEAYSCQECSLINPIEQVCSQRVTETANCISTLHPVFSQVKVSCGISCGNKLKHRERNTAGIDILKHLAHCLSRRGLVQRNHRQLIPGNCIQHICLKTLELIHCFRLHSIVRHVAHEPVHNGVAIEHNIDREQLILVFIFSG